MMKSAIDWFLGKSDENLQNNQLYNETVNTTKDLQKGNEASSSDNDSSKENSFLNGHLSENSALGPHSSSQKFPYDDHPTSPWGCSLTPKSPKYAILKINRGSLSPTVSKVSSSRLAKNKSLTIWDDLGLSADIESPGFAPRVVRSVKSYSSPDGLKKYPISQSNYIGTKALPNVKLKSRPKPLAVTKKASTMPLLPFASSPVLPFSSLSTGFLSSNHSRIPDLSSVVSVLDSSPKPLQSDSIRDPTSVHSVVAALQQAQNAKAGVKRMRHTEPEDSNKKQRCGTCANASPYPVTSVSYGTVTPSSKEQREGREKRPLDLSPSDNEGSSVQFQLSPDNKRRCIPDPRIASFSSSKNIIPHIGMTMASGRDSPFSIYDSKRDSDSDSDKSLDSNHSQQSEHSLRDQINISNNHLSRDPYDRSESQTPQSIRGSYGLSGTSNGSRSSSRTTTPPRPSHSFSLDAHKADKARSQHRLNKMLGRLFNVSDEEIQATLSTSSSKTSIPSSTSNASQSAMPSEAPSATLTSWPDVSTSTTEGKNPDVESSFTFKLGSSNTTPKESNSNMPAILERNEVSDTSPTSEASPLPLESGVPSTESAKSSNTITSNCNDGSNNLAPVINVGVGPSEPRTEKEPSPPPSYTFALPSKTATSLGFQASAKSEDTSAKETSTGSNKASANTPLFFGAESLQSKLSSPNFLSNALQKDKPTETAKTNSPSSSSSLITTNSSPTLGFSFGTNSSVIPSTASSISSSATSTATSFIFGTSTTSTSTTLGGFNFNSQSQTDSAQKSATGTSSQGKSPPYSFGNPVVEVPKTSESISVSSMQASGGLFSFGQISKPQITPISKSDSSSIAEGNLNTDTPKNFSFSLSKSPTLKSSNPVSFSFTSTTSPPSLATTSTITPSNSPFTFGSSNNSFGSQFKFGSKGNATPSGDVPTPSFGASGGFSNPNSGISSTSNASTLATSTSTSGFSFNKPISSQSLFNFGQQQSKTDDKAPNFTFGSTPAQKSAATPPVSTSSGLTPSSQESTFTFGASTTKPFGGPTSTVSFRGTTSAPTFGSTTSAPTFGPTTSTPSFGTTTSVPSFGGITTAPTFGATTSAPSFGSITSVPTFGSITSAPTFGSTNSAPKFGGTISSPTFGSTTSAPKFGSSVSSPTFGGSTTAPIFGSPTSAPKFGNTTSTPTFGGTTTALSFGTSTVVPSFGSSISTASFGGTTTAPSFGGSTTAPSFGNSSAPSSFGAGKLGTTGSNDPSFAGSSASLFGGSSKNLFGSTGGSSLFGTQPNATAGATTTPFGSTSTPASDKKAAKTPFQFGQSSNNNSSSGFNFSQSQGGAPSIFQFGSEISSSAGTPQFGSPTPQFGTPSNLNQFSNPSTPGVVQFGSSTVAVPQFGSPSSNVPQFGTPSMIPNFTPGAAGGPGANVTGSAARRPRARGARRR